jgi:hypothetical protein
MRTARILGEPSAEANSYHVMSRAIEGRFIFDELGKECFQLNNTPSLIWVPESP